MKYNVSAPENMHSLADLHSGGITASCKDGKTSFTVTLPMRELRPEQMTRYLLNYNEK